MQSALPGTTCEDTLVNDRAVFGCKRSKTYLGVLAGFEERCDACKAVFVIPHHNILTVIRVSGHMEGVVEHCEVELVTESLAEHFNSLTIEASFAGLAKEALLLA